MKNKLVKKLFVLGLAAMMVISTVVGCGKTDDNNDDPSSSVPEGERPYVSGEASGGIRWTHPQIEKNR